MISPLLREPSFRRFWLGETVSLFGDQISLFAIPLTAVLVLHAGPEQMGLLTAAGLLPSLLFSLHAGVRVDRRGRRRRTMIAADLARAALLLTVPAAYLAGGLGLPQLYLVAFGIGVADVFFAVAYSTLFVAVVRRDDYVAGQSLLNGSRAVSGVGGQSLAGLLVAVLSAPGALLLDAVSFVASAFALHRIDPAEPEAEPAGPGHLAAGIRFIRRSVVIRAMLLATTTVNFFTFAFNAIFILYATRTLHVHPAVLGLVLGAGAVGAVLGSMVTTRIAGRIGLGRSFALGCVLFPAPLAFVPLATGPRWAELGALFLAEFGAGLGVMILDIAAGTVRVLEVPDRMLARVSGAYRMVNYGVRPLGALAGGTLGAAVGLPVTLWVSVIGATSCVLWLLGTPLLRAAEQPEAQGISARPASRATR